MTAYVPLAKYARGMATQVAMILPVPTFMAWLLITSKRSLSASWKRSGQSKIKTKRTITLVRRNTFALIAALMTVDLLTKRDAGNVNLNNNNMPTIESLKVLLKDYLDNNGIKPGTKTAAKVEHAILYGAACNGGLPQIATLCMGAGRSILSL